MTVPVTDNHVYTGVNFLEYCPREPLKLIDHFEESAPTDLVQEVCVAIN